jgi:SNF2 family DNA or RNA helicase
LVFKDRLLYLLQPPLENLFAGKHVQLPFTPFPYQLEGIAFLMPRHGALLADEMGLGKTAQAIVAMRLLLHAGLIRNAAGGQLVSRIADLGGRYAGRDH